MSELLALVVHDLRSPVATIGANVSFVREVVAKASPEAIEALDDVELAVAALTRGLEHLAWIARWLPGSTTGGGSVCDARAMIGAAIRRAGGKNVETELPGEPVLVSAPDEPLTRLVEVLVRNACHHTTSSVVVRLTPDGVIEVRDTGRCIGADLRAKAFTLAGQQQIKGRAEGRYEWMVGLLAARALADGMGATLDADGVDGAAVFRIRLEPAG